MFRHQVTLCPCAYKWAEHRCEMFDVDDATWHDSLPMFEACLSMAMFHGTWKTLMKYGSVCV